MKIYTKTGDKGQTGLVDNSRVSKADVRIEALGVFDEANAHLGVVASLMPESHAARALVLAAQSMLFNCGAFLADPRSKSPLVKQLPTREFIQHYEQSIDTMTGQLPPLTGFILPGGTTLAAEVHVARTVVRRAERVLVALSESGVLINPQVSQFINRLSDWLFTLARFVNKEAGADDVLWYKEERKD